MNIVYYHGMDSEISDEKRTVLETFGKVTAPKFDYRSLEAQKNYTPLFDADLLRNVNVVIGSSMGGLMAYTIAQLHNIPCLLFNPALCTNTLNWSYEMFTSESTSPRTALAYFVLGEKDDVVPCEKNRKYIEAHVAAPKKIMIEPQLAHRIPIDFFSKYCTAFFHKIKMQKTASS